MEKKNNNGVLIGLLLGIIVMLLIFIALFATNTISLNSKNNENNQQSNNVKNITGIYAFSEFAPPNQTMIYELEFLDNNTANLDITGFQTAKTIRATVKLDNNKYNIVYEEDLCEGCKSSYKEGDILFSLYEENDTLYTSWNKLQPMLESNKKDGIYFTLKNNIEEQKKDNREEVIAKLKEKLTDEAWVKENLHSKKDCFNRDVDVPNHDLRFAVLKDKNNYPMVIIFDDAIDNWIETIYKVYYENNEVKAKNIFNEVKHPSHGGFGVDVNQNVVISIFAHMGSFSYQVYDVTEDEPKLYDEYKCSDCEYEYKGEKTYSTVETKELTKANLDTFLK